MTPLQRAARRLVTGHRRQTARITGWVSEKGEAKSTASRAAVLAAVGYVLWQTAERSPAVLWLLAAAWVAAAWRAAPKPPPAEPPAGPRASIVQWLTETIGDRPGIHLYELYPTMRLLPGMGHHDDTALREALTTLDIPITRAFTIGDVKGRSGIRLTDLTTPPPSREEQPLSTEKDAGETPCSTTEESPESDSSSVEESVREEAR
ncbi:hypothetical protein ACF1BR_32460 [Streptomyces rubiginosohelvolus]|uniref:hypothetical protein n=1 Tax=Streptomyces rubiginosohelvolus TaxID=67362 RepID=UPI0036FE2C75